MAIIRLDKYLSSQLNISRKDAKLLLRTQCVKLNGVTVVKGDLSVDLSVDEVSVNGKLLSYKAHIYVMLNKPVGIVSASSDDNDITVVDILPESLKRKGMFPAGRLDKDTTGFVLLTDDGEFAHNILSPSHHVQKTYIVEVKREVTDEELGLFMQGMKVGDDIFKPAEIRFLDMADGKFSYELKITEGRYHQIKRMFASIGNPLIKLHRTAIGGLMLDASLSPGESREISDEELIRLKSGTI